MHDAAGLGCEVREPGQGAEGIGLGLIAAAVLALGLGQPNARTETVQAVPSAWPRLAAIVCGVGVILLPLGLDRLIRAASTSTEQLAQTPVTPTDDAQASATGAAR